MWSKGSKQAVVSAAVAVVCSRDDRAWEAKGSALWGGHWAGVDAVRSALRAPPTQGLAENTVTVSAGWVLTVEASTVDVVGAVVVNPDSTECSRWCGGCGGVTGLNCKCDTRQGTGER